MTLFVASCLSLLASIVNLVVAMKGASSGLADVLLLITNVLLVIGCWRLMKREEQQ